MWIVEQMRYPTDRPTDRPMDTASYRGALLHLKRPEFTVSKSFFKLLSDRYFIKIAKKVETTCSPTVPTHFL